MYGAHDAEVMLDMSDSTFHCRLNVWSGSNRHQGGSKPWLAVGWLRLFFACHVA